MVPLPGCSFFFSNGKRKITIIETTTGPQRGGAGDFQAPTKVLFLAFAPDGKTLATSCADTTIDPE